MSFLTDRPIGTVISLNDLIHAVDVDDLADSPFGTSKQYTLAQLKTILDSDNQDLSNVLFNGFTTGANDISIDDNQVIKATNGSSSLDLRYFGLNDVVNLKGNLPSLFLSDFGCSLKTAESGGSETKYTDFFISGTNLFITMDDTVANKRGSFFIMNNHTADQSIISGIGSFPGQICSQDFIFKQGVINSFIGGGVDVILKTDNTSYSNQFGFNTGEAFETILNYTTATQDNTATLQDASGVIAFLSDVSSIYGADNSFGSGRVGTITDTLEFSNSNGKVIFGDSEFLQIDSPNLNPLSFYKNDGSVASVNDAFKIPFHFNDSLNVRTLSNSNIEVSVKEVGIGDVKSSMILSNVIKINSRSIASENGGVLIHPTAGGLTPQAFFDITQGSNTHAAALLVKSKDTAGGSVVAAFVNSSNLSAIHIKADLKVSFNSNNTSTGDVEIKGFTDSNLFYSDAGLDRVGIGTATAQMTSKLTVTGDAETLGSTNGFIVLDRTNATRYRIYSDGGVLSIETA